MKEKIYNTIAGAGIWTLGKVFPEYFAVEPLRPTDRYIEYPWVLKNLPPKPAKVLDVGCSGSMFPLFLEALGYETHGIDIREYYPRYKFFFTKRDIIVSMFKNNEFDCITAISTVEHIGLKGRYGSKEDLDGDYKAIREIQRILKPKGILLMTVPFGVNLEIHDKHRVYNYETMSDFLCGFQWDYLIEPSPEADYDIALIKAIKCESC